jgi:hypothetical protein
MDLSMEQQLVIKFCFKAGKSAIESLQMLNAAYGAKHYPFRMFSIGIDNFVMDENTLKTTLEVADLQIVAVTTVSRRFLSCYFKTVTFR